MARHWVRSGQLVETTLTMADGDTLLIERLAGIRVRSGQPVVIGGRDIRITNDGEISGDGRLVSASGDVTLINQSSGNVFGGTASVPSIEVTDGTLKLINGGRFMVNHFAVDGTVEIRNKGAIGDSYASSGSSDIRASGGLIINAESAMIGGSANAILMSDGNGGSASAATTIRNNGLLTSNGTTILLIGDHDDVIVNNGVMRSGSLSPVIDAGGGNDRVINNVTMMADVRLGDGDDLFINTGSFIGTIHAGAGDDRIVAGADSSNRILVIGRPGRDVMTGGASSAIYYYQSIEDSSPDLKRADVITDLAANDAIDLRGIDADITQDGHQRFANVGVAAFSGTAGEVRIDTRPSFTAVLADVDGDGIADFAIRLTGQYAPAEVNFFL